MGSRAVIATFERAGIRPTFGVNIPAEATGKEARGRRFRDPLVALEATCAFANVSEYEFTDETFSCCPRRSFASRRFYNSFRR